MSSFEDALKSIKKTLQTQATTTPTLREKTQGKLPSPSETRPSGLSLPDESESFSKLFGAVKPIHNQQKPPLSSEEKLHALRSQRRPLADEPRTVESWLVAPAALRDENPAQAADKHTQAVHNFYGNSEQVLEYRSTHTPKRLLEQLKRGKLKCAMEADLHGMSVEVALELCSELLSEARDHGVRVVRMVHGKGSEGKLKLTLAAALQAHPHVLAFASAPGRMGGSGALLVLVQRKA